MSFNKILGVALMVLGLGLIVWPYFFPVLGTKKHLAEIADYGSSSTGNPNAIYVAGGVAALVAGGAVLKRAR